MFTLTLKGFPVAVSACLRSLIALSVFFAMANPLISKKAYWLPVFPISVSGLWLFQLPRTVKALASFAYLEKTALLLPS
jgi:hypothetical protein